MSELGERKSGTLFDHLVGSRKQCGWNLDAQRLGGLEIDNQLDLRGLHDRQVGWLFALENPPDIDASLAISIRETTSVAHQAAGRCEFAGLVDSWHGVVQGQCGESIALAIEKRISAYHERARPQLVQGCEDFAQVRFGARVHNVELQSEGASCFLHVSLYALGNSIGWVDEQCNALGLPYHPMEQL